MAAAVHYRRPVRILLALRAFPPETRTGVATLSAQLHEHLRARHDVRLVAGYFADPTLLPSGATTVAESDDRPLATRLAYEIAVRRAALRFRPDVLVCQGVDTVLRSVPTVALVGDPYRGEDSWGRLASVRRSEWRRRLARAAVVVTPTAAARRRLELFGASVDGVRVAWPGVDLTRFQPDTDVPVLPPEDEVVRLLYAARFEPGKAQHVAIEALKGLGDGLRSRLHLDLVGAPSDPQYLTSLRRRADGYPVSFHLDVVDIAPWYRRSHIVLFPTVMEEIFGHSAVDAMACGKPVIHSRVAVLDEVLDGRGVAVPAGDVKRLGEAIRELVRSPERCRELAEGGRRLVLERYRLDDALARYEALIVGAA